MAKKVLSVLLAAVLIFSAIPLSGVSEYLKGVDLGSIALKASAAGIITDTISGQEAIVAAMNSVIEELNRKLVTPYVFTVNGKNCYTSGHTCSNCSVYGMFDYLGESSLKNQTGYGYSCNGFARYMGVKVFGTTHNTSDSSDLGNGSKKSSYSTLRTGDIFGVNRGNNNWHWMVFVRAADDGVDVLDCNANADMRIRYHRLAYTNSMLNGPITAWRYTDAQRKPVIDKYSGPSHTHSYVIEYEAAHPHKQYRKCYGCGDYSYTGVTRTVSNCTICNPPTTVLSRNTTYTANISSGGTIKYYTFTPPISGKYVIYSTASSSDIDACVSLYNSSGTEIASDDDSNGNRQFLLAYNLTADTTYKYAIKLYSSSATGNIPFTFGDVYTITYNANGGSGAPASQEKYYGKNLTLSSTMPTRSGYTFRGWATSSTSTYASYSAGSTFSNDYSSWLYAVWEPSATSLSVNSTYTANISSAGETKYYTFTPSTSGKYVIYATGSADSYVTLYNASGSEIAHDDDGYGSNNQFLLAYNLTAGTTYKYGIKFYSSSATGSIPFTLGNVYTVSYNANGGTGAPASQEKYYGKNLTLSSTTPTRSGYTFKGWATSNSAASANYSAGSTYSSNSSVTLYAVWEAIPVSLSVNSNYSANISTNGETKYYTFTPSLSGKYVIYSTGTVDSYVTLYNASGSEIAHDDDGYGSNNQFQLVYNLTAGTTYKYGIKFYSSSATGSIPFTFGNVYTVSYNANGGTGAPASQEKYYGKSLTLSSTTPTRSGYTFKGWATSSSAASANYSAGGTYTANASVTLYAVWTSAHTHSYTSAITTEATCTTDGLKTYRCSCGNTYTETITKLGHSYSTEWFIDKEPTCTEDGLKTHHCIRCSSRSGATKIPATGEHSFGAWVTDKAATCTEDGSKHRTCSVCKTTETRAVTKLGHNYSTEWTVDKQPTCTESGLKTHHCTRCSSRSGATAVPATGHSFGAWVTDKAATCTQDGTKHRVCSVCKATETAATAKLGHNYSTAWTVDKSAACGTAGSKSHHCTRCSAKTDITAIPATGAHTYGAWIVEKEPTAAEGGTRYKVCSSCGNRVTESTERLAPGKTELAGIANAATGVLLSWNAVDGADSYTVYRKAGTTSGWSSIKTVSGSETSFTDTSVISGNDYTYTVKASNAAGAGGFDKTGLSIKYLAQPAVAAANKNGYVNITWNKITGANGYIVYGRAAGDTAWTRLATVKGNATVTYADKTAKSGIAYRYTVRAYNGSYRSSFCVGAVTRYLSQPTVSAANANGNVTVKWSWVTGAKGYYVYRKAGSATSWTKIATVTSASTYADKNVTSGTAYKYTVKAYNGAYSSTYCAGAVTRYLTAGKISSAVSGTTGITVKWGKVTGAQGYNLYRKVGTGSWVKIAAVSGNTNVAYLDKSAVKGTTYTYCVRPYNGNYAGTYANTVNCKDKY